jgi:antitoxin (DNA-binding transcriptional repressor) of toxin-antitoxin stability system
MGGEEIMIAKAGKPVARLGPYQKLPADRHPGSAEGLVWISASFFDPRPDEALCVYFHV